MRAVQDYVSWALTSADALALAAGLGWTTVPVEVQGAAAAILANMTCGPRCSGSRPARRFPSAREIARRPCGPRSLASGGWMTGRRGSGGAAAAVRDGVAGTAIWGSGSTMQQQLQQSLSNAYFLKVSLRVPACARAQAIASTRNLARGERGNERALEEPPASPVATT